MQSTWRHSRSNCKLTAASDVRCFHRSWFVVVTDTTLSYLTPEANARVEIDKMLATAGWVVQGYAKVNLGAAQGVAVREFVLDSPHGRVGYLLFVDRSRSRPDCVAPLLKRTNDRWPCARRGGDLGSSDAERQQRHLPVRAPSHLDSGCSGDGKYCRLCVLGFG